MFRISAIAHMSILLTREMVAAPCSAFHTPPNGTITDASRVMDDFDIYPAELEFHGNHRDWHGDAGLCTRSE